MLQAELFVLRLSRNSGVLGLAGMPFVSQIFSSYTHSCDSKDSGILVVRPLLDFSKEDMYKVSAVESVFFFPEENNSDELFFLCFGIKTTMLLVILQICRGGEQNWVEDPTNQSLLYARNRIRASLRKYSSCEF